LSSTSRVTVLIPAKNEERDIERCLRAILAQDHAHDRMEIVLVDGGSADRTAAVARSVLADSDLDWRILDNPVGTTPSNLNAGLAAAAGEILCRVDARSIVPPHYVRLCAEVLSARPEVVVTGGCQVAVARDGDRWSRGIARGLNNRYTMGGARYRSGASSGPVDTVYLGAFRTEVLRSIQGWDEFFHTNQDYELNRRLGTRGLVWFDDQLEVEYLPRTSIRQILLQYHRFGRWKVRYWRRTSDPPRLRQVANILLPLGATVIGLGAVIRSDRPRRSCVALLALAAAGVLVVEEAGHHPRDEAGARASAAGTVIAVSAGWLGGVAREAALAIRRAA